MNNCNCNKNHGARVVPGCCVPKRCVKPSLDLRIKTELIPASAGTDEKDQPFAPKTGAYQNTIVQYDANKNVYFYDSRGIWTKIEDAQEPAMAAGKVRPFSELPKNANIFGGRQ